MRLFQLVVWITGNEESCCDGVRFRPVSGHRVVMQFASHLVFFGKRRQKGNHLTKAVNRGPPRLETCRQRNAVLGSGSMTLSRSHKSD